MGLIDRMLADLIGKNTGLDHRMVRRLLRGKGKGLLMMGGAAALGAALSEGARQRQAPAQTPHHAPPQTPQPASTQPTLPPLPPLPPIPGDAVPGAEPDDEPDDELPAAAAYPIVRAMVAAALADGELSDAERETIHGHLDSAGLAPEQTAQIHRDLVLPPSVATLAAASGDAALRAAMYRCAGAVVLADGSCSDAERRWLDQLAAAFAFDAERRNALEREIFDAASAAGDAGDAR